MMAGPRIWALVPVKSLAAAKTRLAPLFDGAARARLARAMAEDVLDACLGAGRLAGTAVVTCDREVAGLAEQSGARVVLTGIDNGTNAAIREGIAALTGLASGIIVVPADVPHLDSAALDTVAGLCGRPGLVLVRASRDGGTNLLACSPPDLIEPSFGPGSFARHLGLAQRLGVEPIRPALGRLDLDLDRPEDIADFLALPGTTRSHRVLRHMDALARLAPPVGHRAEPGRAAARLAQAGAP